MERHASKRSTDGQRTNNRPPPPKRDVDVDLGFVRVRLAASDGDDLPALVDAVKGAGFDAEPEF